MAAYFIIGMFVCLAVVSIQTTASDRRKYENELRARNFPDDLVVRQGNVFVLKTYARNAALLVVFCYLTIFLF